MRTVFLSYRRGDSEGQARALNFELVKLIGKESVFMDVDSIALGQDFRHVLHERLESCDLFLALIGPGWLDAKDSAGNRRLENPTDLVRQEIAAALKRNIPVTPVLLQGAQMPPLERLPDDIKELVYRNGFELGHSTWESDVREMVKRLGLDKESAVPAHGPVQADASSGALAVSRPFKAYGVLAAFVLIAIAAAVFFYQKTPEQSSQSEIVGSPQQSAESSPQQPAGASPQESAAPSPQQSAESSPQQSAAPSPQQSAESSSQQPAGFGFGAIKIANLKTRTVEVYDQKSSAEHYLAAGYAGTLSPTTTTLQVPAGTYKLKFGNHFVEHVAVTSARSPEILLGTISLPNLTRKVEVYDQKSSAEHYLAVGYAGTLSPTTTTLQVPAGTYKLKFDNHFVEHVAVTSARSLEILLGTISLPNLTRKVEVYDQKSSAEHYLAAGYAGTLSSTTTTLQVPAGTYKLKFDNHFVEHVAVTSARSLEILLGSISLPKLNRKVEVYDQKSSAEHYLAAGYAGELSQATTTLQVPAGTYKLKFDNLFGQPLRVESGKTVIAK